MLDILKTKYTKPIEREYESWIVQEIEKYFNSLGIKCVLLAVSPKVEKQWPADIQLFHPGIAVGLQFKRAMTDGSKVPPDLNDLYWSLGTPKGQFYNILVRKEIYYCLPTFINRSFSHQSLHHSLFWRPDTDIIIQHIFQNRFAKKNLLYLKAKYGSKSSDRTQFTNMKETHRWGYFAEMIPEIGIKVNKLDDILNIIDNWTHNYDERPERYLREFKSSLWDYSYRLDMYDISRELLIEKLFQLFKQEIYGEYEEMENRDRVLEGGYLLFVETK